MSRVFLIMITFAIVWTLLSVGAFIFDIGRSGYTIPSHRNLTSKIFHSEEVPISGLAFLITSVVFYWFG